MKHFCYGTFGTVLRLCALNSRVQKKLHEEMMATIEPVGIRRNDSQAKRLFDCEIRLNENDAVVPARNADITVVTASFKEKIVPILDSKKQKNAILAIRDLIAQDSDIDEDIVIFKSRNLKKRDILTMRDVALADFLANTFLYATGYVNNLDGKESIPLLTGDYIASFDDKRGLITLVENLPEGSQQSETDAVSDNIYLSDAGPFCPLCYTSLWDRNNQPRYRKTKIIPTDYSMEVSEELGSFSLLDADIEAKTDNHIVLCLDCDNTHRANLTNDACRKLLRIRQKQLDDRRIIDSASQIKIDAEIESVIKTIAAKPKEKLAPLEMTAVDVAKKINEDADCGYTLLMKISALVSLQYKRVQKTLSLLDVGNRTRSKEIAEDVHSFYLKCKRGNYTQEEIFEEVVKWLMRQSETNLRAACEILAAFFVQECDVFDVITK